MAKPNAGAEAQTGESGLSVRIGNETGPGAYFPNSKTMNEPGTTVGRGLGCSAVGAGVGPYSAVTTKT